MSLVLRLLANGWQTEIDSEDSPPYLRNPDGQRYQMTRSAEGYLTLHSSTSKVNFDRLLDLYRDYMAWERGKPGSTLPEGWRWDMVPDSEPNVIWGATKDGRHFCYIDGANNVEASETPAEVVAAVLRARRGPRVVPPDHFSPPADAPTRFEAIREGTL